MSFCTVTDIEQFLQVVIHTDPVKNASALRAIAGATAAIKNYCHQQIESMTETITLDCTGGYKIFLPELPATSVTSVVERGETLSPYDDYILSQYGILRRENDDWPNAAGIVTITYTHGYTVIPDDIVSVCTRAASRAYQAGLRAAEQEGVPGVNAMTLGDYSVTYGGEAGGGTGEGIMGASAARILLLSEKDILNRYRYKAQ